MVLIQSDVTDVISGTNESRFNSLSMSALMLPLAMNSRSQAAKSLLGKLGGEGCRETSTVFVMSVES